LRHWTFIIAAGIDERTMPIFSYPIRLRDEHEARLPADWVVAGIDGPAS